MYDVSLRVFFFCKESYECFFVLFLDFLSPLVTIPVVSMLTGMGRQKILDKNIRSEVEAVNFRVVLLVSNCNSAVTCAQ